MSAIGFIARASSAAVALTVVTALLLGISAPSANAFTCTGYAIVRFAPRIQATRNPVSITTEETYDSNCGGYSAGSAYHTFTVFTDCVNDETFTGTKTINWYQVRRTSTFNIEQGVISTVRNGSGGAWNITIVERGHITDGLYYGAPVTQTIDARAPTDCFRTGISDTIYDGTNHFVVG